MHWDNRVVWTEGMFLRAQHFQQLDRFIQQEIKTRNSALNVFPYGFTRLAVDRDLLATGIFAIKDAAGILPDGTSFRIPEDADPPTPIEFSEPLRDFSVSLAIPLAQIGGIDTALEERFLKSARYRVSEYEVDDTSSGSDFVAPIQVGRLNLRFVLSTEKLDGFAHLPVARIVELRSDRSVMLDDDYIPTVLTSRASPILTGYLNEVRGLINTRTEALADRVRGNKTTGVAEMSDFLMLQALNARLPVLNHFASSGALHPELLYQLFLSLAGELATFNDPSKRPAELPPYQHENLRASFGPLMGYLRQMLSAVLEQTAIPIPLETRNFGIRVGRIPDPALLTDAMFVLAVKSDRSPEEVRQLFPRQASIGSVEQIRDLVNSALPGIRLQPLQTAPRQIPFQVGLTYFDLERTGQHWQALGKSGGIALHSAGDFPGLEMALWAIRG